MKKTRLTIIKPQAALSLNLQELWKYRELFYIFAWRDIKVRYKQTFLGIAWAIFQPLVTMVIFTFFFGKLAGIPSGNLPYMLFVYIGLVIWTFFSNALTSASNSLVDNGHIIKKVYFPRLVVPLSSVVTALADFGITLVILVVLMVIFRAVPSPLIIVIFPILLMTLALTISGIAMFLSSVNIKYRDVRYILPFFIQILMFLTPVIYPSTIIAAQHKWVLLLNPLTGIIETTRTLISGSSSIDWQLLTISITISILLFLAGLYYFRKTERFFADIL